MNGAISLPPWARQILIGIGLFVLGAALAFGYSYRPLHGALSWQIDQLESRLDERNRENRALSDALTAQQSEEAQQIDPDTFAQVERELEQTKRVLAKAEKDLRTAERKRKDANNSAAKWRKRFEELERKPAPVAASSPAAVVAPVPSVDGLAKKASAAPPASPSTSPGSAGSPPANANAPNASAASSNAQPNAPGEESRAPTEGGIIPPTTEGSETARDEPGTP